MTPEDAMIELLGMVGVASGSAVQLSKKDLSSWPTSAVAAMKAQRMLKKTRPAETAVCPGCEESCTMPVNTLPAEAGKASWFIVCDKRPDINRVPIAADDREQWRSDPDAVCSFVSRALGIRRGGRSDSDPGIYSIGIAIGIKRSQMLSLAFGDDPALVAGDARLPLAELVRFDEGAYILDDTRVRQLVDQSRAADSRHTPSNARREVRRLETKAMHEAWQRAYRELKRTKPGKSDVWYSQQIAKSSVAMERSAETIRKNMKR